MVSIVMGSASDTNVMRPSMELLDQFKVQFEVRVLSAHRTPAEATEYARTAKERGIKVIIAGAGAAAHLPGVVAAHTTLPVIGIPIASSPLRGVDALYAIVQMPRGIPVASVGLDNSANAALFAIQILALEDDSVANKLAQYRDELRERGLRADEEAQAGKWRDA